MKKRFILISCLCFMCILIGCGKDDDTVGVINPSVTTETPTIKNESKEMMPYEYGIKEEILELPHVKQVTFATTNDVNLIYCVEGNRGEMLPLEDKIKALVSEDTKYDTITLKMYDINSTAGNSYYDKRIK